MPVFTLEVLWPEPAIELDYDKKPTVEMQPFDPAHPHSAVANIFFPLKPCTVKSVMLELPFDTNEEMEAFVAKMNAELELMADNDTPEEHRSRWLLEELLKVEKERV